MTVECTASAIRFKDRVDTENEACGLLPVGVVRFGIEETQIGDGMLLVVSRHHRLTWRYVRNARIERRWLHEHPYSSFRIFGPGNLAAPCAIFVLAHGRVYTIVRPIEPISILYAMLFQRGSRGRR